LSHPQVEAVIEHAMARFDATVDQLSAYLAIPAISCEPEHAEDVRALASKIRDDLETLGMDECQVLEIQGSLPIVTAEWMKAGPDAPTVLVYGHLDLQPVAGEIWHTPPHEATRIGDRLYARGSADDMGGWVSHIAALEAWLAETGGLPVNLKVVIEGEEEIGSPNLERYMDAYPHQFEADVMVLTDCENPSAEIPGLTVSLRGLLEVELKVSALDADVHSGLWGGMVPDVSIALMKLVNRLTDDDGRMAVGRVEVPEDWRTAAWDTPITVDVIEKGAHIIEGVNALPDRGIPPAEWMWRQPSLTVVATTLPTPAIKKNALRRQASAILSIRLAPGQTGTEMLAALEAVLLVDPPGGVKVDLTQDGWASEGWLYEPKGPAFDAADRAYERAWGAKLARVGVGGSIPFVALFGNRFGDLPLILNGVMDPETTAHGPNESMHLGIFEKAIRANIYLFDELGTLGKAGITGE
jgi:acetylornithine deacetylase/succinyl-diaminopimelate desuccinylase-like protein